MISAAVFVPKIWSKYDRETLLIPWDRLPIQAYQNAEEWIAPMMVGEKGPSRTRFPTFKAKDADRMDLYWQ